MSRIPILEPLLLALRSRRVVIAIVSVAVALLVARVPELAPVQDALIVLIGTVALALITGMSWEDAARASRQQAGAPATAPDAALREAVRAVLDELGLLDTAERTPPK